MLDKFFKGDSCVLFAYGITNAGKTHTIQGEQNEPGILPRLVNALLEKIQLSSAKSSDLKISMLEIYQEKLYDLLGKKQEKLAIRDGNGRVEVVNLSSHSITSSKEAFKLLTKAAAKRSKGHTLLNSDSSRSHAMYTITLNSDDQSSDGAMIQVIDLAGAERA